jgi:hypothetical protein
MYYKEGIHTLIFEAGERVEFKDFHWRIREGSLNFDNGVAKAEIILWENLHEWLRWITFPTPPEYNQTNLQAKCYEQILTLSNFEGSVIEE